MSLTSLSQAISVIGTPLLAGGAVVGMLLVAIVWRVVGVLRRLTQAGKPGREASAGLPASDLPLTTFNRKGHQGDPVNVAHFKLQVARQTLCELAQSDAMRDIVAARRYACDASV